MSNRKVTAAAEGLPKFEFTDLEGQICDLALAVGAAKVFVGDRLTRGRVVDQGNVQFSRHEADLIEHLMMQAENLADDLRDSFYAIAEAR